MGRKTLESLPGGKPLEGRENIVLTRNKNFHADGVTMANSPEDLLNLLHGKDSDKIFIIGGAQIHKPLIPYCKEAFVTKIKGDYDVDTYHPNLDSDSDWLIAEISPDVVSSNGIIYNRYFYENNFFVG